MENPKQLHQTQPLIPKPFNPKHVEEWNKLDGFLTEMNLGKYSQDEILNLSNEFRSRYGRNYLQKFWEIAINSGSLNAEGLFKVATDINYPHYYEESIGEWNKKEEITALAIGKGLLSPEQLIEIASVWNMWGVTMDVMATNSLSDDQIINLVKTTRPDNRYNKGQWNDASKYLHLNARTPEELKKLGEKVQSDEFWQVINKVIDSKSGPVA